MQQVTPGPRASAPNVLPPPLRRFLSECGEGSAEKVLLRTAGESGPGGQAEPVGHKRAAVEVSASCPRCPERAEQDPDLQAGQQRASTLPKVLCAKLRRRGSFHPCTRLASLLGWLRAQHRMPCFRREELPSLLPASARRGLARGGPGHGPRCLVSGTCVLRGGVAPRTAVAPGVEGASKLVPPAENLWKHAASP